MIKGIAPPNKLGVFNNTVANGYRAFAERYFRCKVGSKFEPALETSVRDWEDDPHMREFCEKLHENIDLTPTATIDEVVAEYKGAKKRVYERAAERYWSDGLRKMDAALKSFVKFEKCDLTKAPRVINPREPVFNLVLGKFLKKNEKKYFEAIARVYGQERVVIKGLDALGSASALRECWDAVENVVAIGGDASKFDMHVSRSALRFEHLCYIRNYCDSYEEAKFYRCQGEQRFANGVAFSDAWSDVEQLAWILAGQLDNRGTAWFRDGRLKFNMSGTRASGDLNTSLGNCIIMSALTYCWMRKSGIRCRLANNGDDCVYFVREQDEQRWRDGFDAFYRSKGFRMVLEETVRDFPAVVFCQSNPIRTDEGLKMVRNPRTLIEKAAMCVVPVHSMTMLRKWMMAVGVGEGSLNRGVPIVQSFTACMRRNGSRCTRKFIDASLRGSDRILHADMKVQTVPITDQARIDFWVAWGITPEEQRALESYYDGYVMTRAWGEPLKSWEAVDREAVAYAAHMMLF